MTIVCFSNIGHIRGVRAFHTVGASSQAQSLRGSRGVSLCPDFGCTVKQIVWLHSEANTYFGCAEIFLLCSEATCKCMFFFLVPSIDLAMKTTVGLK